MQLTPGKRLAYAIFRDSGSMPAELADFSEVETLVEGEVAAAYSRVGLAEVTPTADAVERFAAVVAALHRGRAVLPLRYGLLDGDDALRARLVGRRDEWLTQLDLVADCDEMGLRILSANIPGPSPEGPTAVSAGTAYLASRRAEFAHGDAAPLPPIRPRRELWKRWPRWRKRAGRSRRREVRRHHSRSSFRATVSSNFAKPSAVFRQTRRTVFC